MQGTLDVVPLADRAALRRRLARWLADAFGAGLDADAVTALFSRTLHDVRRGMSEESA